MKKAKPFTKIALIGRQKTAGVIETLQALLAHLTPPQYTLCLEAETAELIPEVSLPTFPGEALGEHCELAIVVGGDGSLLQAAHKLVDQQIPVIGINRGHLGFLTDIHPTELNTKLARVLAGEYREESRTLLQVTTPEASSPHIALNDVVITAGNVVRMIECEIQVDDEFICTQRGDGLIIATPTGSTAYSLSGGGPILHPSLEAFAIVPMCPHMLNLRPMVVNHDSTIRVTLVSKTDEACFACDGGELTTIQAHQTLEIKRYPQSLRLIHPLDYHYFETLRTKMLWGSKPE